MTGERAYQAAMKIKTEKWLLCEAAWKAHDEQPDRRTVLGYPEVSWTVAGLLQTMLLHWRDLPEQVRYDALKAGHRITNFKPATPRMYRR
jgi:hypothetical protein